MGKVVCKCRVCEGIHFEFIARFGRWPNKTHDESVRVAENRKACEASWDRALA